MTVLAEFEMNTGLPVGLVKQGIVPYYYLKDQVAGLARSALEMGYRTHFYHPYKQNFWAAPPPSRHSATRMPILKRRSPRQM